MRTEGVLQPATTRQKKKKLNVKRTAAVAALLLVFFVGGVLAGAWYFLSRVYNPVARPEAHNGQAVAPRINVLVMGLDGGVNGPTRSGTPVHTSRTDTMMVLSLDPELRSAGILSIPRDTRVKMSGKSGYDKITHAHVYGGPKLALETVQGLIGEPIPYYVRINFAGFVKLIDMIGGVEMTIDHNMDYDDPYQNLHIHLKAGKQVLDGEKSLQFVRYRQYPQGDIDRVKAQQKFLSALMKSFFDMNTLWKLPSIAREAANHVDTNIEPALVLTLANAARQLGREDVKMDVIPGQPADISDATGVAISYWVADQHALKKMVDLLIRGIDRDANSKVRVEVVNGTGTAGMGEKAAKNLRDLGYLVTVTNAEKPNKGPTRVIGAAANSNAVKGICREVAKFAPQATIYNRAPGENVDVSILLGVDCNLK
ncbi:MAG: LCP family protein [Firmicutes bacterium]|nr:LCP family protein [Bacillota bacterium]